MHSSYLKGFSFIRGRVDGSPRDIICMGTCRTLHPQRILCAPDAISLQDSVSQGKPRTRALRSGIELHYGAVFVCYLSKYTPFETQLHGPRAALFTVLNLPAQAS